MTINRRAGGGPSFHYNFARSPIGSKTGSGCWANTASLDNFAGGFEDWVNNPDCSRPANVCARFIDTSAYMIVATEEVHFSSIVD